MQLSNKISFIEDVQVDGCIVQKMVLVKVGDKRPRNKRVQISYVRCDHNYGDHWLFISDNHWAHTFQEEPGMLDLIAFANKAYNSYTHHNL
jgi:hypothetical protein